MPFVFPDASNLQCQSLIQLFRIFLSKLPSSSWLHSPRILWYGGIKYVKSSKFMFYEQPMCVCVCTQTCVI